MNLPPLQSFRAFVRIAESGQFRRAAEQLGLTESAVGHQVGRLETRLGVRLFERRPGGAMLTAMGRVLFNRIQPALSDIEATVADLSGIRRDSITITMAPAVASMWLAERLTGFYAQHPEVRINVVPTTEISDLPGEQIDFAVRMGSQKWRGCLSEKLMQESIAPIGAPAIVHKFKVIGWKRFIRENVVIVNSLHPDEWQLWCTRFGFEMPPTAQVRHLSSFDLVARAAAAGLGIAMGRSPLSDKLIGDGELVHLFPERILSSAWYFLVRPAQLPMRGAALKVYRWLRTQAP